MREKKIEEKRGKCEGEMKKEKERDGREGG